MPIHVQDEETDWLVRDFARKRGVGITAAIKLAIEEATSHERQGVEEFARRIEPIIEQIRALKANGFEDEKAFMDDMWGEND